MTYVVSGVRFQAESLERTKLRLAQGLARAVPGPRVVRDYIRRVAFSVTALRNVRECLEIRSFRVMRVTYWRLSTSALRVWLAVKKLQAVRTGTEVA